MLYRWLTYLGAVCFATMGLRGAEVVPLDDDWRYWVGVSEASEPDTAAWRLAGFDDSGWDVAPAPFWYGQVQPAPGTELTDMRGSYSSVFLRRTFPVGSVADVSELELQAASDDGFIAWINGQEVARFNMPGGDVPFDGTSLGALGEVNPWPTLESYPIANPGSVLVEGENVLAIHAFNASMGNSSDFVINASLSAAVDLTPPLVAQLIPSANAIVASLVQVEVVFSEGVTGVDAGDLLINGVAATDVGASTDSQYVFSFPQPDLGQVVVEWAADHGITDLSSQRNAFGGGNWVYELDPDYQPPPMLINEFMASNNRTLNDAFGDDSDWVELYNPGDVAVDLNGWYLTDQMDQLTRWRFPQVVIEPKGFLMVFASGRNLRDPLGQLHTDFVLGKGGGYLALVNSQTNVVAEFAPTYPPQETDISYGLDQSNPTWVGYFSIPTPGGPNAAGGAGFAPEVVFSEPSGTFIGSMGVELGLAYAMPGAVIRYTTDGSVVTETSPVYTGSLTLNNTTQVRARSFADGLLPSVPVMGMYIEVDGAVANYTSDLPVIILHNYGGGSVPTSIDQPVLVQAFEPMYGVTSLTNAPGLVSRGVFHLRGSSTLGYPKGSFFLETHDEDEFPLNVELLGLPRESDWVLYAPNNFEPILINNAVAHELSRQMGEYSPRTRFAVVFLNTGGGTVTMGNYNGIYVLEEKIKVDKNRVDIDRLQPEHVSEPEVTGGYLLSVDRADPGTSQMSAGGQSFNHLSPRYDEIITPQRAPQRNYIRDYLNEFYSVLTGPNWKDPVSGYAAYLDVDAAINHSIQGVVTFNVDGLRLSSYLRKPRGGKIVMGPVWDFDRTQGSTDGRDFNPTVWQSRVGDRGTDYFNADGTYSNPWYRQLFQDIDFWQRWVDRYQELRSGAFSDANVHGIIEMFADQVRQEQPNEVNRWGVRPRSGTRTVDGYSYNFSGTYQGEVQWVKHWYSERLGFIDGNLLPRPVLSREAGEVAAGTRVTLSGPTGATLYYTLDGTDPRLPQGGVSSAAMVYTGPVVVNENVRLVARARDLNHSNETGPDAPPLSTPWSGVVAATYVVSTPELVISEVMFHAGEAVQDGTNTAGAFEYVELLNRGGSVVSLPGVRLSGAVEYVFDAAGPVTELAAGGRVVVVADAAAFALRYPGKGPVGGAYAGGLDNGGERLVLHGPLGEPIHDFRYEDDWYLGADGYGFSLVLRDEGVALGGWGQPAAWRVSTLWGGSPGEADPAPAGIAGVLVNEILTHTDPPQFDSVELYNPGLEPADIGGWWLTDNRDRPFKFQIPAGTVIDAGGYVVFDEREFTNTTTTSFRLSSLGDEVYLFSTDGGTNLTGYVDGTEYGASQNGVSFGRLLSSTGREWYVAQSVNTLGSANAGPRVGPVVINEIQYDPAPYQGTNNNTRDEFVELRNLSDEPVPLYDVAAPTNTWRLRGGVDFDFPEGFVIPAGGYVVLTGFDPEQRALELAAFRAVYGLVQDVTYLGPYEGVLDNAGEAVRLYKPDPPQGEDSPTPGYVPYVLVDAVEYEVTVPWPTNVLGTGFSLQRLDSGAFGGDPVNWHGAEPTPGAVNAGAVSLDGDGDGLPSAWELAYGLDQASSEGDDGAAGDPDGDGLTNYEEYLSGTHPLDAADVLALGNVGWGGTGAEVRFRAVAGKSYSILVRSSLTEGDWVRLADVPVVEVSGEIVVVDPEAVVEAGRYYRLVTPQLP